MPDIDIKFYNGCLYGLNSKTCLIDFKKCTIKVNVYLIEAFQRFHYEKHINIREYDVNLYLLDLIHCVYTLARIPVFDTAIKINGTYATPYYDQKAFIWTLNELKRLCNNDSTNKDELENSIRKITKRIKTSISPTGVNTYRILKLASDKKLNIEQIDKNSFRIGNGEGQMTFTSTITNNTNQIFTQLSKNKIATKIFLRKNGLPTPDFNIIKSKNELLNAAEKLGYPLVVKPYDRDQGLGVYNGIKTPETLIWAYETAMKHSYQIMLEKHAEGHDFRVNVYNGKIIEIYKRIPGGVIGNGKDSIEKLIVIAQNTAESKRRSQSRGKNLLCLDDEALSLLTEHKTDQNFIPKKGEFLPLRRKANLSSGGRIEQINIKNIPKSLILFIEYVSSIIQLDFFGIDFITQDLDISKDNEKFQVIEINAQPQLSKEAVANALFASFSKLKKKQPNITLIINDDEKITTNIINSINSKKSNENIMISSEYGIILKNKKIKNSSGYCEDTNSIFSSKWAKNIVLIYKKRQILENGLINNKINNLIIISDKHFDTKKIKKNSCKTFHLDHIRTDIYNKIEELIYG